MAFPPRQASHPCPYVRDESRLRAFVSRYPTPEQKKTHHLPDWPGRGAVQPGRREEPSRNGCTRPAPLQPRTSRRNAARSGFARRGGEKLDPWPRTCGSGSPGRRKPRLATTPRAPRRCGRTSMKNSSSLPAAGCPASHREARSSQWAWSTRRTFAWPWAWGDARGARVSLALRRGRCGTPLSIGRGPRGLASGGRHREACGDALTLRYAGLGGRGAARRGRPRGRGCCSLCECGRAYPVRAGRGVDSTPSMWSRRRSAA